MDDYLSNLLPRLELRARQNHCSIHELLDRWLSIDEKYEIEKLALFANVLQEMPVSLILTEVNQLDTPIIYANRECEIQTGYSSNELLGQSLDKFLSTSGDQSAIESLKNAVLESRTCNLIVQTDRKDGRQFENEIDLKPLFDDYGHVTHFVAVQYDVTSREILIRESELHRTELSSLLKDPSNAVLIADNEGRYIDCNAVACLVFGVEKEELIGNTTANFVVLPEGVPIENMWGHFLETGYEEGEIEICCPDCSRRTLEYRAYANYQPDQHIFFLRDISEQKHIQSALEHSLAQLCLITEVAATYAVTFEVLSDGTLQCEWLTPNEFEKITGYTTEESAARGGWAALSHPDDLGIVQQYLTKLLTDATETQTEFRIVSKSGDIRHISAVSRSIKDDSGKVTHIYGMGRDITEQKLAQKALERSEEQFRRLIETAPIAIVVINSRGQIVFINARIENLFGYEHDELMGESIEILVPEYLWEKHIKHRSYFFTQPVHRPMNKGLEVIGQHKSGGKIPIEVGLSYYDSEEGSMAVAFITDATERHRTLESLAYSAALIQSSHDAIIGKTIDGTIVSWNPGAEYIYGYTKEEVVGKSISILVPEGQFDEVPNILNRIKAGETVDHYETIRVRKDGSKIDISLTISPIRNTDNRITGVSVIARDITQRKQVEQALHESERFAHATVDALSAHIAILDVDGMILTVNKAWKTFGEANGMRPNYVWEGINYLGVCDSVRLEVPWAADVADGIRSVTKGQARIFDYEYPCHTVKKQEWYIVRVTRFANDAQIRVVVAHENITKRKQSEEALRQSQNLLEKITNTAPFGIYVYDVKQRRDIYNNKRLLKDIVLDETSDAPKETFYADYVHPDDQKIHAEHRQRLMAARDGEIIESELRGRNRQGEYQWLYFRDTVFARDAEGNPSQFIGSMQDITERKQAEEKIAFYREHLEELVAQRTAELAVSNTKLQIEMNERRIAEASEREQRILAEALRNVAVAVNKHDLDAVLDEIVLNIGYVVAHDAASLVLLEGDIARVIHAYGLVDNDMFLEGNEIALADSQILVAMHAMQEPLLIADVYKNPLGVLLSQAPEGRSFIGVPLINAGRVIGFISLFSNTPDYFTQDSVSRLKMFAEQTTVAITNAQLYQQSREIAILRERQQIARNLHDAVTQTMFSASIIAETLLRIQETEPRKVKDGLVKLHSLTRGAVAEARHLLFELRPDSLVDADLSRLVMQVSDAFEGKTGIKPMIILPAEVRLPPDVKITFYWIMQEALNNIEKHAQASEVSIELTNLDRRITLIIRDNGHGFITTSTNSTQLGMKIMYERAETINAKINIDSHLDSGTIVTVEWTGDVNG